MVGGGRRYREVGGGRDEGIEQRNKLDGWRPPQKATRKESWQAEQHQPHLVHIRSSPHPKPQAHFIYPLVRQ
jgi:hypothetical protein